MKVDAHTPGELWDLHSFAIPPRSRLYHLEPIGVETPYVESLTGYVTRLAEAHCVPTGVLIINEVAPLIKEGYPFEPKRQEISSVFGGDRFATRKLNGTQLMAAALVQALETLTTRSDLRYLTMRTWVEVVPKKGLLKRVRAWCSSCYEEWRATGQVIYEPLIWALDLVTLCPCHHHLLQTCCPHCYKQLPQLAWCSRPGYCSKCGEWLGVSLQAETSNSEVLSKDEFDRQLWVIDQIGELIATAPHLSSYPSREKIKKALSAYINQSTGVSVSAFAHYLLGKSTTTLNSFYTGKSIPQLNILLQICYCLGVSLLDFLIREAGVIDFDWIATQLRDNRQRQRQDYHRQSFDSDRSCQALKAALNEYPPPTLQEVARRLKARRMQTVKEHFPDLCHHIVERHSDYRKAKRSEWQQHLLSVLSGNEYPSPSMAEVGRRIGVHDETLRNYFPSLCQAISARYLSHRKAASTERQKQLTRQIRQIAFELHDKGVNPNGRSLGKILNKPGVMRREEAVAALREVRRELGYEK